MSFQIDATSKHSLKALNAAMGRALNRFFQFDNGKLDFYTEDWPELSVKKNNEETAIGPGVRYSVNGENFSINFLIYYKPLQGGIHFLEWSIDGEQVDLVRWLVKRGYLRQSTLVSALTKDDARAGTKEAELAILSL